MIQEAGLQTAGLLGTNYLVDKLPIAQLKTGSARPIGKAVVAIGAGYFLRRFVSSSVAKSFTMGGLMSAALDVYAMTAGKGVSGIPYGYETLNGGMGAIGYFDDGTDAELNAILDSVQAV